MTLSGKSVDVVSSVREVLLTESRALASLNVDEQYQKAIELILSCPGKLVAIGLGKAGLIARKASATFCSTGTPSLFLHPGEAGHGDIGILNKNDIIIAYSTSGKTREVIETIKLSKKLGVNHVIGITSHEDSEFRKLCDVIIEMGDCKEACPLNLTPTTSTTIMLGISDAIAITIMKMRHFTKKDFGIRHHAGYLGSISNGQNDPFS